MIKRIFVIAAAIAASPVLAADADTVVASRGGQSLTLAELDARVHEIPAEHRAGFMDGPQRIEKLVRDLLLIKQLAAEAEQEGLDKEPIFAAQLELARKRVLSGKRLAQIGAAKPSGDLQTIAREAYTADPSSFRVGDTVEVRHLLVKTCCHNADEARALAEGYRQRVADGKDTLAQLATRHSEDAGTKSGGGLLTVEPGKTVKPFEEAAFALKKPGDLAPVVRTEYGFHVIELVVRHPGRQRSFDEVEAELVETISLERRTRAVKEHTETLQNLPIEADANVVASLRTRYASPGTMPQADPAQPPTIPPE